VHKYLTKSNISMREIIWRIDDCVDDIAFMFVSVGVSMAENSKYFNFEIIFI
jgi:hypothetical protein